MDRQIEKATTLLVVGVIFLHLKVAPFTKVEESFSIQATYDVLVSGVDTSDPQYLSERYDHVEFSGPVPRTFLGAIVLTLLTATVRLAGATATGLDGQLLVRGILGLVNGVSIISFRNAVSHTFGSTAAVWYILLQTSQFHVMYYASRTLPNMFAFAITTLALRNYIYGLSASSDKAKAWYRESLFLLTFAGVVFRAEIAVLVFSVSATLAATDLSRIRSVIVPAGLIGLIVALLATVTVDSYFWQKFPTWPELEGFYYNTVLGKSSDWGVSPVGYYFTNALPKLMFNPVTGLLLVPLAISQPSTRSRSLALILPSFGFLALYSILPHKEWRFIIYIIPALTATASIGASWIWTRRFKNVLYRILALMLSLSTITAFIASASLSMISGLNYPGGEAVIHLQRLVGNSRSTVHVYADNLACQTGLTRFLEDRTNLTMSGPPRWHFDKTDSPDKLLSPVFWNQFDYVIAESPERTIGKFEVVDVIRGYAGIQVKKPGQMLDDRSLEERFVGGKTVVLEKWEERWNSLGEWMRERLTRGWWVVVKMEPKLRILRRQKSPVNTVVREV